MYKKLVLSGGGVKGYSYLGVMKYLEETEILNDIEEIVGCSIGSLIGFFIILGYTSQQVKRILMNFNLNNLLDFRLTSFVDDFGLDNGIRVENLLKSFIRNKGHDENLTLSQIQSSKKFVITVCCVNKKCVEWMSKDTYPNIPLHLAVRASMSIPMIFSPVKWEDNLYVDGGLVSNLPVRYYSTIPQEDNILCLMLKGCLDNEEIPINSLRDYLFTLMKTSMKQIEKIDIEHADKLGIKVIYIYTNLKSSIPISLEISVETKQEMYDIGYKTIKEYLTVSKIE